MQNDMVKRLMWSGLLAGAIFALACGSALAAESLTILWAQWDPANYLQEIERCLADHPKNEDQSWNTAFGCVLQIDVMEVSVPAARQRTGYIRRHEAIELAVDLLGAESKPGVRLNHSPASATHNCAA